MSEGKNDTIPPTPANPGGLENKSPKDLEFNAAYASIRSAIERGDKDGYVKGLDKLAKVMRAEVIGYHAPPKIGDLHHTFMEWQARNQYITTAEADRIKAGLEVNKNSDTLDNNLRPHHDIPGDTTMANNSKGFGGTVARYINGRGHGYISGSVVPGVTEQNSAFMVETIFKGFPKLPAAK